MFYYNKNSCYKIFHTKECDCIKYSNEDDIRKFPNWVIASSKGYQLCEKCNLLLKKYILEKESVLRFCQQYGFSFEYTETAITIKTSMSKWKIALNNTGMRLDLYHRNKFKDENSSFIPEFHFQNSNCDTIMGYLDYIYWHDIYRRYHPLKKSSIYPKLNSPPPKKGTKRYHKNERRIKRNARKKSIANVLSLIKSLESEHNNPSG